MSDLTTAPDELTTHAKLLSWVDEIASLTEPDSVHWCDGSAEEYDRLAQVLIDAGTFERLDEAKRPNSYLALSDPGATFTCEVTFSDDRREVATLEIRNKDADISMIGLKPKN